MSMKINQQEEQLVVVANSISKLPYALVIITCFGFLALFMIFAFGEYIGFVYQDPDIVRWCAEYNPTWTYEACASMVGR